MKKLLVKCILFVLILALSAGSLCGCDIAELVIEELLATPESSATDPTATDDSGKTVSAGEVFVTYNGIDIPYYSGSPSIKLNNNKPFFTEGEITDKTFELYGQTDELGRCTSCVASVGRDCMPDTPRESISEVKPTGWMTTKYDFIDGNNLYNRCHLIAYSLTGENVNRKNLITGTRYMNAVGMLEYEEKTAAYVRDKGNHVMYRVTPVFVGNELVARGVVMEGYSVEDKGKGICFCVFCYNVQPGVVIDYMTGNNRLATDAETGYEGEEKHYILNTNSMKFHDPDCPGVADISEKNRQEVTCKRGLLIDQGYQPCQSCNP